MASVDSGNSIVTVHPTLYSQLGTHIITLRLSDTNKVRQSTVEVTVKNRAPIYSSIASYPSVSVSLYGTKTITIPAFIDPDGIGAFISVTDTAASPVLTFSSTTSSITITP